MSLGSCTFKEDLRRELWNRARAFGTHSQPGIAHPTRTASGGQAITPIAIGQWEFDQIEYDAEGDVLYLTIGEPRPSHGRETPEDHVQLFDQKPTRSAA